MEELKIFPIATHFLPKFENCLNIKKPKDNEQRLRNTRRSEATWN